jgi:hypothetical protein
MVSPCSPYTSTNLAILGVIHRDGDGAPLLAKLLNAWQPEVITLEFSSYGLQFRQTRGEALKRRVERIADEMRSEGRTVEVAALEAVRAYLDPSYEFSVASDYAVDRIPLFLIDGDRFSRPKLADVEELISRENLEKLLSGPLHDDCRRQKAMARLFFDRGLSILPYTEEMGVRDREMRDRIAELMTSHKGARLLHICGWQHLCDPLDLYRPLNPTKVFIYDKALCI